MLNVLLPRFTNSVSADCRVTVELELSRDERLLSSPILSIVKTAPVAGELPLLESTKSTELAIFGVNGLLSVVRSKIIFTFNF